MLPGILNQLGAESLTHLKRLASNVTGGTGLEAAAEAGEEDDDEVPDLVENFDEASKDEKPTEEISKGESELSSIVIWPRWNNLLYIRNRGQRYFHQIIMCRLSVWFLDVPSLS